MRLLKLPVHPSRPLLMPSEAAPLRWTEPCFFVRRKGPFLRPGLRFPERRAQRRSSLAAAPRGSCGGRPGRRNSPSSRTKKQEVGRAGSPSRVASTYFGPRRSVAPTCSARFEIHRFRVWLRRPRYGRLPFVAFNSISSGAGTSPKGGKRTFARVSRGPASRPLPPSVYALRLSRKRTTARHAGSGRNLRCDLDHVDHFGNVVLERCIHLSNIRDFTLAKFDYDFHPTPGAAAPAHRLIVEQPDMELRRWKLPPATFKSDGLPMHHIAVQLSSGITLNQRIDGRVFNGWLPVRSSSVTPAGTSSSTTWDKHRESLVLSLRPSLVNRLLEDDSGGRSIEFLPRITEADAFVADVVHLMARHATNTVKFGSLLLDGLTASLVAYLALNIRASEPAKRRGGLTRWQVQRVLDLIEGRLNEEVSLSTLAAETGLSERYFCTAFRHTIGVPPYRYLLERRIARAKALLQSDRALSITAIAMAVGFQTSAHFATTFRNLTGLTPSSYRDGRN